MVAPYRSPPDEQPLAFAEGCFLLVLFVIAGLALAGVILGEWRWLMGETEF